ncbi:hypothetical protein ACJX0J_012259, partial [Zea mays]
PSSIFLLDLDGEVIFETGGFFEGNESRGFFFLGMNIYIFFLWKHERRHANDFLEALLIVYVQLSSEMIMFDIRYDRRAVIIALHMLAYGGTWL